jgi:hypothetical protein
MSLRVIELLMKLSVIELRSHNIDWWGLQIDLFNFVLGGT